MRVRRRTPATARAVPALLSLSALLTLSACEKPTPLVTLVNEGRSIYSEAGTWCFEGQSGDECVQRDARATRLEVRPGQVGVDVGKEVSEGRWIVSVVDVARPDAPQLTSEVQEDTHYYVFDLPELARGTTLVLTVRALAAEGEESRGVWQFELVPR